MTENAKLVEEARTRISDYRDADWFGDPGELVGKIVRDSESLAAALEAAEAERDAYKARFGEYAECLQRLCMNVLYDPLCPISHKWPGRPHVDTITEAVEFLLAERERMRTACEQGRVRAANFLKGMRMSPEDRTATTIMVDGMIQALQFDFEDALGIKRDSAAISHLRRMEKMEEALKFYADANRYEYDNDCCCTKYNPGFNEAGQDVLEDSGKRARAALAPTGEMK